jgi:hypothetical protein
MYKSATVGSDVVISETSYELVAEAVVNHSTAVFCRLLAAGDMCADHFYRLGYPYIASMGGIGYFLAMTMKTSGHDPYGTLRLARSPLRSDPRTRLPQSPWCLSRSDPEPLR